MTKTFARHQPIVQPCLVLKIIILVTVLFGSGCSHYASRGTRNITQEIANLEFNLTPQQQIVIIYNHGVKRPQQAEPCHLFYNQPPQSLRQLEDQKILIYSLCSTAVESPAPSSAGKQVYLRMGEINQAIDALLAKGIQPRHLFLSGHSNGGWTSLMMMRDVNKRFNGAIVFAPAFAGKRAETNLFPWWRNTVRPRQIADMLSAPHMDALVFAYLRDPFNRPEDLAFLTDHYPLTVSMISYDCGLTNSHQTYRQDCRQAETSRQILDFINQQIAGW